MRKLALLLALPLLLLAACTSAPDDGDDEPVRWPELAPGQRWQPPPGTAWQWQLTGRLDTSVKAPVYDVDGFNTTKEQVATLKKAGRKTICYLSTGAGRTSGPTRAPSPGTSSARATAGRGSAGWTSGG